MAEIVECFNDDTETQSKPKLKKVVRIYSNSKGNTSKLPQQKKTGAKSIENKEKRKSRVLPSHKELLEAISGLSGCCAKGGSMGCLLKIHGKIESNEPDCNAAISMIADCRRRMQPKTSHERQSFIQDLFSSSIAAERVKDDGTKEFEMCYVLNEMRVCKKALAVAYGFSVKKLEKCSAILKVAPTGKVYSLNIKSYTSAHIPDFNFAETEEIFRDNFPGELMDHNLIRACLTPSSEVQSDCVYWLEQYFATYGDWIPNGDNEIRLALIRSKEMHDKYMKEQLAYNPPRKYVDYSKFNNLWKVCFPNCSRRPWCGIPGKCSTCCDIDQLRRSSEDSLVQKKLAEAHHLHRAGMHELQRHAYKDIVRMCEEDSLREHPTKCSCIGDKMDQHHSQIPFVGTQDSFSAPLKQVITGVKQHGANGGVTLYRSVDTVPQGANLMVYCILAQLEAWKKFHGYYPEELYVQIDGGSENANKCLLSMLELLVVKRIVRLVYYTRLPPGHTHEDIDACFGLVWSVFRSQHCETLEKYRNLIENALGNTKLNAKVVDIHVLPDYWKFLEGCMDEKLSRLHKGMQTQLQWRFQAVTPSALFPLGCKTVYRAYCGDNVVEFVKKPKSQCLSQIGQFTGLEATYVKCSWFPAFNSDPTRKGTEGFYLLRNIPDCDRFYPCAFPPGARERIESTLKEVRRRFHAVDNRDIIQCWQTWKEKWAPLSDCAVQYVADLNARGLPFHCPLKGILLQKNVYVEFPVGWNGSLDDISALNKDVYVPEVCAYATNSVLSDFNPNPSDPRIYDLKDLLLMQSLNYFYEKRDPYYDVTRQLSAILLSSKLRLKVPLSGEVPNVAGTKAAVLARLRTDDVSCVTALNMRLNKANHIFIKRLWEGDEASAIKVIGGLIVTRPVLRCLRPLHNVPATAMVIFLQLLRERNTHIATAYASSNPNASPYLNSVYCGAECFDSISANPHREDMDNIRGNIPWNCIRRIYFTVRTTKPSGDGWLLLVACHDAKQIFCVSPHLAQDALPVGTQLLEHAHFSELLVPTLQRFYPTYAGDWPCSTFPADYLEPLQHINDSGVMVWAAAYMMSLNCPIIFAQADTDNLRGNIAYWCTKGELPI